VPIQKYYDTDQYKVSVPGCNQSLVHTHVQWGSRTTTFYPYVIQLPHCYKSISLCYLTPNESVLRITGPVEEWRAWLSSFWQDEGHRRDLFDQLLHDVLGIVLAETKRKQQEQKTWPPASGTSRGSRTQRGVAVQWCRQGTCRTGRSGPHSRPARESFADWNTYKKKIKKKSLLKHLRDMDIIWCQAATISPH
jgi:hypothetical protein